MSDTALPEVKVFVQEEPNGKLAPIFATVDGLTLPLLDGSFGFDPNGISGTRAATSTVRFLVGGDSGFQRIDAEDAASHVLGTVAEAAEALRRLRAIEAAGYELPNMPVTVTG